MDAEARQRAEEIHRLLLKAAPLVEGTAYGPSIRRDTAVLIEQATPLLEQYVADAVAQAIKEKTDEADKYHMLLCVEIGRTKAQAEEIARLGRDIEAHKLEIVRCRADVAEALRREPAWTDRQSGISMTLDGGEGDDC